MSKSFVTLTLVCVAIVGFVPIALAADSPRADLGQNAALRYWLAFQFMHDRINSTDEVIDTGLKGDPLKPEALQVVQDFKTSLTYLHQGGAIAACDWGLNWEDGYNILLPYLNYTRTLGKVAILRAEQRLAQGDRMGAVEDFADALALARHAGTHDILVCIMVQRGLQDLVLSALTPERLAMLDGPALDRLADRLDHLPPGGSLRGSVRIEQEFGQKWFIRQVKQNADRPDWAERSVQLLGNTSIDVNDAVKQAGGTPRGVISELEKLTPIYDELATAIDSPESQWEERWAGISKRFDANPFGRILMPAYGRAYRLVRKSEGQLDELRQSIKRMRQQKSPDATRAK